jgi:hypothetical protein
MPAPLPEVPTPYAPAYGRCATHGAIGTDGLFPGTVRRLADLAT